MQRLKKENRASSEKAENFIPRQEPNSNGDPTGSIWENSVAHSPSHRGRTPPFTGFGKAVVPSFCTMLHHQQQVTTTLLSLSQAAPPRQCCGFAGISGAVLSCPCARKWLPLTMEGTQRAAVNLKIHKYGKLLSPAPLQKATMCTNIILTVAF